MGKTITRTGRRGGWKNVTSDAKAKTWNSSYSSEHGGMLAGIELRHNGTHLGVMFPDGRIELTQSSESYKDPRNEIVRIEKEDRVYEIDYDSTDSSKFDSGSLVIYKKVSGCSCTYEAENYCYCPHCGVELP